LYEFEGCPFCRKVREQISILDLDVIIYPTPRETLQAYGVVKDSRFRPVVMQKGGKAQFPYLIDENTNTSLYESDEIINYLWKTYGGSAVRPKPPHRTTLFFGALLRPLTHMGALRIPSKNPEEPLVLYAYESSPGSRMVREALCVLELPYQLKTVAIGSPKRKELARLTGGGDLIPFLVDPNTKFESASVNGILTYLYKQYQNGEKSKETWFDYSTKGASATHGTVGAK